MKSLLRLSFLILPLLFIACDDNDNDGSANENFRVIHLASGVGSFNLLVDDELRSEGLAYTQSTGFLSAPDGEFNVKVASESTPDSFFINTSLFIGSQSISLYLIPETFGFTDQANRANQTDQTNLTGLRSAEPVVLTNSKEVISGASIVRFLHGSLDALFEVDFYIGTSTNDCTNVSGLSPYSAEYGNVANSGQYLLPLTPGEYDLCIFGQGTSDLQAYTTGLNLEAETRFTIVLYSDGLGDMSLMIVDDTGVSEPIVIDAPESND
jgi:hypothetical protein